MSPCFFSSFFVCWPCGQKRLIYLTRMRRGSNNRETPKGVPSSKNNRQLVTCRPFRDSCMGTKPNSYRHGSYRLGRVYRQGSKTLFHAYRPRSLNSNLDYLTHYLSQHTVHVLCVQSPACRRGDLPKIDGYDYPPAPPPPPPVSGLHPSISGRVGTVTYVKIGCKLEPLLVSWRPRPPSAL